MSNEERRDFLQKESMLIQGKTVSVIGLKHAISKAMEAYLQDQDVTMSLENVITIYGS